MADQIDLQFDRSFRQQVGARLGSAGPSRSTLRGARAKLTEQRVFAGDRELDLADAAGREAGQLADAFDIFLISSSRSSSRRTMAGG
jgi:hypothetical protein